jgi:hypothetical protein
METAMFYFANHAYVMMVHYEGQQVKMKFQEDFFFDENRKNKDGFAVVQVYLPKPLRDGRVPKVEELSKELRLGCMRTLVMGIKSKSDKIFEYNIERNFVYELFNSQVCMADFALTVYNQN